MELLVFDAREFRSMLMTTPGIGVKMLARLAERLADADAQLTATEPATERHVGQGRRVRVGRPAVAGFFEHGCIRRSSLLICARLAGRGRGHDLVGEAVGQVTPTSVSVASHPPPVEGGP